jgi:hypothetical protein
LTRPVDSEWPDARDDFEGRLLETGRVNSTATRDARADLKVGSSMSDARADLSIGSSMTREPT